jgi:hypothetical protein
MNLVMHAISAILSTLAGHKTPSSIAHSSAWQFGLHVPRATKLAHSTMSSLWDRLLSRISDTQTAARGAGAGQLGTVKPHDIDFSALPLGYKPAIASRRGVR